MFSSLHILVVDDYPDSTESLALLLKLSGYPDVTVAHSAKEALDACALEHPDIALVEPMLRKPITGWELAGLMQKRGVIPIALTTMANAEGCRRARQAGFTDLLLKTDSDAVLAVLASLARMRRRAAPFVLC
jgi:CheY-like chemotaxis protein